MFDAHAQKMLAYYSNIIVMLQIFDNLFHYKNVATVQWIKRLKDKEIWAIIVVPLIMTLSRGHTGRSKGQS